MFSVLRCAPASFRLTASFLAATLALGCSSGGGGGGSTTPPDLRASDLTGTWALTKRVTAANGTICEAIGTTETVTLTITVTGTTVSLSEDGSAPYNLTLTGSRVRGTATESFGGGLVDTRVIDFGITNGQIAGTEQLNEVGLLGGIQTTLCNSSLAWTGTRTSTGGGGGGTVPVTAFNGTWSVTTTSTSSNPSGCSNASETFTVTISVSGSTATLTQPGEPAQTLPIVNGRLQGTLTDSAGPGTTIALTFNVGLATSTTQTGTLVAVTEVLGATVCTENLNWNATKLP